MSLDSQDMGAKPDKGFAYPNVLTTRTVCYDANSVHPYGNARAHVGELKVPDGTVPIDIVNPILI